MFGPTEAKKHLSKVVMHHQLLKLRAAKGEWGGEDDKEKALKIIPPMK